MIPPPEIVDDKFEHRGMYIECYKWTCPECGEANYSPAEFLAENMYNAHYNSEHPELTHRTER